MSRKRFEITLGILLVVLVGSCGSDDGETGSYQDNIGRHCKGSVTRVGARSTCDATPTPTNGCDSGERPCFSVNRDSVTNHLRNCETCCAGDTAREPLSVDCKLITCKTSADCLLPDAFCDMYFCFLPPTSSASGAPGPS